ncbi:outer membrane lipoprotein carrier protein LolA [Nitrincola sp. MINF-07-Sa-05]|uniref:outer membrane lipoprotein carrier protein LolA n=1 Tax=Nitrincola salilacus TaxID=3400273 RepID=UPI0039180140
MKAKYLLILSGALSCSLLFAAALAADSEIQLPDWQGLDGRVNFTQHKHISGLKKPVLSSGYLLLEDEQLLWHTQKPVSSQVLISAAGVSQLTDGAAVGSAEAIAGSEIIGQLLLAVLQQRTAFLHQYFTLTSAGEDCFELRPHQPPVDQFFTQMTLCGDQTLNTINLLEHNGNRTLIELELDADQSVDGVDREVGADIGVKTE